MRYQLLSILSWSVKGGHSLLSTTLGRLGMDFCTGDFVLGTRWYLAPCEVDAVEGSAVCFKRTVWEMGMGDIRGTSAVFFSPRQVCMLCAHLSRSQLTGKKCFIEEAPPFSA